MNPRPHRIGRRRARLLLDGDPAARAAADARLAAALEALRSGTSAAPGARYPAGSAPPEILPPEILAAFARSAPRARAAAGTGHRTRSGARGPRSRRVRRALAVKASVVLLALSGGTVAAATADALPGPAQRAAHRLLGSWGVPAPAPPPHRQGPDPAPGTGSVLPGGAASAGARPSASPKATDGDPDSAGDGASPSGSPCAGHGHGDEHACAATGTGTSGGERGKGDGDAKEKAKGNAKAGGDAKEKAKGEGDAGPIRGRSAGVP